MKTPFDVVKGRVVDYDPIRRELTIKAYLTGMQRRGTGELTVVIRGNETATVKFKPSQAAIENGLRKASQNAAYDNEKDEHPHTSWEVKRSVLGHLRRFWCGFRLLNNIRTF